MINVVIAESDPMVASINVRYINSLPGMKVRSVFSNGQDAWAYVERNEPELLILELHMPGLSGLELLRRIRSKTLRTEVIIVTAANDTAFVEKAIKLGSVDYLIKPFEYCRFCQAVNNFSRRRELLMIGGAKIDQGAIDSLLRNAGVGGKHGAVLQKGLSGRTASYIADYMAASPFARHTCGSLSSALLLSRVTVRRYLNYFIEAGSVNSVINYETGGRPGVLYMYVG